MQGRHAELVDGLGWIDLPVARAAIKRGTRIADQGDGKPKITCHSCGRRYAVVGGQPAYHQLRDVILAEPGL